MPHARSLVTLLAAPDRLIMKLLAIHRIAQVLCAARQQQLVGLRGVDLDLLQRRMPEHRRDLVVGGTGMRQLDAAQMPQAMRRIKPPLALGVGGLEAMPRGG
jgi:hypothetical protein